MVLGDPEAKQLLLQGLSTATFSNLVKLDFRLRKTLCSTHLSPVYWEINTKV